jgi:hypothetical protein
MVREGAEGSVSLYGCAICLTRFSYGDELQYHYEHDHTGRIINFIVIITGSFIMC